MQLLSNGYLPAQLTIRCAGEDDLAALEWDGEFVHFRRLFAEAYKQTQAGQAKIWIAVIPEDHLIGQVLVSLNGARPELSNGVTRAYIYGFRVKPKYRNRGIGRLMMHTVEEDLLQAGFYIATLNVAHTNPAARRFYERFGYSIVANEPGYWSYLDQHERRQDVYEPAWRMEKELS
jgi:ribosomal protein S18 acetylase RimI-like enzyme